MSSSIGEIVERQRDFFRTNKAKDVGFRIEKLKRLESAILAYEKRISEALHRDLHRSETEGYITEIGLALNEISYAIKHLSSWAKPKKVRKPLIFPFSKSLVIHEPYGVVLIIAPWNYPLHLTMLPLVGAIAAGNCVAIKPSEMSPNTSKVIHDMIEEYFEDSYIACFQGNAEVAQQLLDQEFDFIFFTGGTSIGRIVMKAAAEHLTPLTLELGGKSPCIVDKNIDVEKTASRIVWGKFINAGQTCIAPDYLLAYGEIKESLVNALKRKILKFYGSDPKQSKDYCRIINKKHFDRLSAYLNEGDVVFGGETDSEELYISPTLIENVPIKAKVMREEIFGPIIPIVEYSKISEAISFVNSLPKPLATYIFSNDKKIQQKIIRETSSGGVCINDTMIQLYPKELPFGGVGDSGFGRYHGKISFESFSNKRSIMRQSVLFDLKSRYPPFSEKILKIVKKVLK
ncbi:MAG TPA: aldehyde dehydrogenase [Thermoplasmata archaeon]|nr:aldehyde dehydrogenase [Thermoplasmata archaeon]